MPRELPRDLAEQAVSWVQECIDEGFSIHGFPSAHAEAARRHSMAPGTLQRRCETAGRLYGFKVVPRPPAPLVDPGGPRQAPPAPPAPGEYREMREPLPPQPKANAEELIREALIRGPRTTAELMTKAQVDIGTLLDIIDRLVQSGSNISRFGDRFEIPKIAEPAYRRGEPLVFLSRPDNTYLFGAAGDKHYASKYHRDDVLGDLYRRFEAAKVDAIFDTGNWIDGEAPFNRYDLSAHGLDGQVRLMASLHPRIDGVTTYAIWGDDHEGWLARREGVDVGKYAEQIMREEGHLWTNLGYLEAHVVLKNVNTGACTTMAITHPGGGSAYATSYAPQKAVEALEGGEKPAVILFGHWHKLEALNIRNVWAIQTGCCIDQTPWARGKRLDYQVGGVLLGLEQDPITGAIVCCNPGMLRYFVRSYYNERWSKHGPVKQPERTVGGV